MTENEIQSLLAKLTKLTGESAAVLSRAQLNRLGKDLQKHADLIEREGVAAQITAFEAGIPPRAGSIYKTLLKDRGVKKPAKSAAPDRLREYLRSLSETWEVACKDLAAFEAELERLRKPDEDAALKRIAGYDAARRKTISKLAGLTKLTERGSAPLNLSTSPNNNRKWLAALRKKMPGDLLSANR